MSAQPALKPSKNAKKSAARLVAVQMAYEHFLTGESVQDIRSDYYLKRVDKPMDEKEQGEEDLIPADADLLKDIVTTVSEHESKFLELIDSKLNNKVKKPELLIKAILLCACAELFTAADKGIDAPIIINDYIEVAKAFFESPEVKLVNGMIDACYQALSH